MLFPLPQIPFCSIRSSFMIQLIHYILKKNVSLYFAGNILHLPVDGGLLHYKEFSDFF